jgi:diacylglycerol kinase family enzyme
MLNLIVAPKQLDAKAESYSKRIVKYLKAENVEYSVYFSLSLEDITANVNELTMLGETEFVVVGNDVVLNQFLNSLKDFNKIKLGIVPTSSKDDFARYLGIESSPILAIKRILNRNIEEIDFLLVNDQKVLNNVIIGSSVEVFEQYSQYAWQSFVTEVFAELKVKNKFTGVELGVTSKSSKPKTENIYELVVANGGYSKGKHVSPLSNVSDGLFNLIYTNSTNEKANLKALKGYDDGKHIYNENVKQFWLNSIKITNPNNKIKALLDGRIYTF